MKMTVITIIALVAFTSGYAQKVEITSLKQTPTKVDKNIKNLEKK